MKYSPKIRRPKLVLASEGSHGILRMSISVDNKANKVHIDQIIFNLIEEAFINVNETSSRYKAIG